MNEKWRIEAIVGAFIVLTLLFGVKVSAGNGGLEGLLVRLEASVNKLSSAVDKLVGTDELGVSTSATPNCNTTFSLTGCPSTSNDTFIDGHLEVGNWLYQNGQSNNSTSSIGQAVDVLDWPVNTYYVDLPNPHVVNGVTGAAFLDELVFQTSGTVSSTFTLACGVTSTIVSGYTDAPATENLIDDLLIVTSTGATAYTNKDDVDQGTSGKSVVSVPTTGHVYCRVRQPYNNGCTGANCEAVTSTNRGWQGKLFATWKWKENKVQ